jgi:flagellar hook-associated protein 3 FlgL
MLSDLGSSTMSEGTYQALADKAISLATEAINEITLAQGRLGTAQERIEQASDSMLIQQDLITEQINGLETVDTTEASVRVTVLQTQVEMAIALIARIEQVSILNYL